MGLKGTIIPYGASGYESIQAFLVRRIPVSKAALAILPLVLLAACDVRPLPPIAAPALTIMGQGTEVRMRSVGDKLYRSEVVDLTTQRPVNDTQVSGHVQFELDATKADPSIKVIGQ